MSIQNYHDRVGKGGSYAAVEWGVMQAERPAIDIKILVAIS